MKYVVIGKDRLRRIMAEKAYFHLIDRIKFAILHDLVEDRCTMNDCLLIFERYAIDYRVRMAIIEIKKSIIERHELPDEIAFVTCQVGENPGIWDNYDKKVI